MSDSYQYVQDYRTVPCQQPSLHEGQRNRVNMHPLKVPYGERDGHLLHVDEVSSGLACQCICPLCQGMLIARKGEYNQPHFAHQSDTNCDGESLLHIIGKRLLYSRISEAISQGQPLAFQWRCHECHDTHEGNLLDDAGRVGMEKDVGKIRPDITIYDLHGHPQVAIEVIVTHEPEKQVWQYIRENDIHLVAFHVEEHNLESLERTTPLRPSLSYGHPCTRAKCDNCKRPLNQRWLYVIDELCSKCQYLAKRAVIKTDIVDLLLYGPERFDEHQIALSNQHGVTLEMQKNEYFQFRYLADTCANCATRLASLYRYDGIMHRLLNPVYEESFCIDCETRPDNREPRSVSGVCIVWNCEAQTQIDRFLCTDHFVNYARGALFGQSQSIPFMEL